MACKSKVALEKRATYQRKYRADWRKRNPDYDHSAHYKKYATTQRYRAMRRHGISPEQYEYILLAQHGKCLICDSFMDDSVARGGRRSGRSVAIDHDHKTGEIRGLLCCNCNAGIGLLGESVKTLRSAIVYLTAAQKV